MVLQAAEGVYQSAQDVVAKQNKELYPNMLDLLAKTTRSVQPPDVKEFLNERRLRFWMKHILPLMFELEPAIQQKAIAALEAVQPMLSVANYETHPEWPTVKEEICGPYCKQLNDLRDRNDSNWHRVWTLLLRLIQRDILRSATLINRYLSIVEMGFRNPNLTVRAEAFLCWKVLVEMFAKSNELLAPKRIKLVCIPLKSSQSKTEQIAVNKFRVWWYLMTELHERLVDYTDSIVEPFLMFCFGPLAAQPLIRVSMPSPLLAPGKSFEMLMPMVVVALASLLGPLDDFVQRIVNRSEMARVRQPFNGFELFGKAGKSLINSSAEATVLIAKFSDVESHRPITTCLWRNLLRNINELKCYDHFNLMLDNLEALIKCNDINLSPLVQQLVHQVATNDLFVRNHTIDPDYERMAAGINRIAMILMHPMLVLSDQHFEDIRRNWFDLDAFMERGYAIRHLLPRLIHFISTNGGGEEFPSIARHRLWNALGRVFVQHVDAFKDLPDLEPLYAFALMPLTTTQLHNFSEYKSDWKDLAEAIISINGARSSFCQQAIKILEPIRQKSHNDVVASLIELEDANFVNSAPLPVAVLDYVDTLCSSTGAATTIKDLNVIAFALQAYTKRLDGAQLIRMYQRLKDTFALLESTVMSMRCDQSACNEFKNIVAHHMRTQKPTQHLVRLLTDEPLKKELSAMQKVDSAVDFVVIPSVWKFNPDRLTDQQRDKMKERRADIPALYNDTSQSQESRSIKPWTPKKLVLQDSDAEPMVIEVESASINQTDTPDPPTVIEVDAEPLPLSQNSSHGSASPIPKQSQEEKRLSRVQNELRKIQMDIVDREFNVTSRTRPRRSSCNSPVSAALKDRTAQRLKNRETESLPPSPRCSKTGKRQSVVTVLTDTDASDQHDVDDEKKKDTKRTPLKTLKTQADVEKPVKGLVKTNESIRSEKRADSPKTTRRSAAARTAEVGQATIENENLEKPFKRILPQKGDKAIVSTNTNENDDSSPNDTLKDLNKLDDIEEEKSTTVVEKTSLIGGKSSPVGENPFPDGGKTSPTIEKTSPVGEKPSPSLRSKDAKAKEADNADPDTSTHVDISTEVIEASQQSPTTSMSINGRRSIRRSAKPTTPNQKPTTTRNVSKSPTTQTMDTLPMDTECVQEVMSIAQTISPPKYAKLPIPAKPSDTQDQAIAEAETEPNTQITLTDSMLNTSTENHPQSRSPSPISPPCDPIHEDPNKSILSSPQSNDFEDRNAEFLNDTLNISPIREPAPSSEPCTPVRDQQQNLQPTTTQLPSHPADHTETPPPPMVVIAASPQVTQKCMTPLQMRYQAGIIQSSTPNLMSAAPSFSAINSSSNHSPSSVPRYSQLKGRGAQLLNMINNSKKKELPRPEITEPNLPSILTNIAEPIESLDTSLPLQPPPRDLLTFSKTLPSPMASPSFSILKRKFIAEQESYDDFESPASKRKRVSFHDPPVSSTKEFIGHADEHPDRTIIRPPATAAPAGSLNSHHPQSSPAEQRMRHILRRKSRADSMVEIAKFGKPKMAALPGLAINNSPPDSNTLNNTSMDMEPLKWNDTSDHVPPDTIISLVELDELIAPPSSSPLHFPDKTALMQHVVDECPLDVLVAKFPANASTARLLARHLANTMKHDADVRATTLDQLAENHPLDFLEYAVRSNYSSAVCSKLEPEVMIDYVVNLAKHDEAVRSSMLDAVATLTSETAAAPADVNNESLHKLESRVLDRMCQRAETTSDQTSAKTKLMEAVAKVLAADQSDTTMTDDQMRLMMQLFNRPMTDNQICECIQMFSRNRKRT